MAQHIKYTLVFGKICAKGVRLEQRIASTLLANILYGKKRFRGFAEKNV